MVYQWHGSQICVKEHDSGGRILNSDGGKAITCGGCLWCVGSYGLMGCRTRGFDSGKMVEVKGDAGQILFCGVF